MPNPSPANSPVPDKGQQGTQAQGGGVLPFFKKGGGRPNIFSTDDANKVVSLLNALAALQVKTSSGPLPDGSTPPPSGKITLSETNAVLELYFGSGAGGGGGSCYEMEITDVSEDDVITAKYLNGPLLGSTAPVAKPFELRRSVYDGTTSPFPDGGTLSYVNAQTRTNSALPSPSYQMIGVPYVVGDVIFANQPDSTEIEGVILQDLNLACRTWYSQINICVNNSGTLTNYFIMIPSSGLYTTSI